MEEGVCAYAVQQADAHHYLTINFSQLWEMEYIPPMDDNYKSNDDDML